MVGILFRMPYIAGMELPEDDDQFFLQLVEVETAAKKLAEFLEPDGKSDTSNQYLPDDFPTEQLCDIAAAMSRVSHALPSKLERAMSHAKLRLGTVRNNHIPRNPDLPYGRGSYVDDLINRLVGELNSALDFYARGQDLPAKAVPENDAVLAAYERTEAEHYTQQSLAISQALNIGIGEADRLMETLDQQRVKELLLSLNSTEILNRLTRAELRHDPRPNWLDGLALEMKDMPEIIDAAADGIDELADVGQKLWDVIKNPGQGVLNLTRNLAGGMRSFAGRLREQHDSDDDDQSTAPPFDLDSIHVGLKKGIRPHPAHVPQITELFFVGEEDLSDLSAFDGLAELAILHLDKTQVSDVSSLSSLNKLKFLSLWGTNVKDLSPLSTLKSLTSLNLSGTPVFDISPLSGLVSMQNLQLQNTEIDDISSLLRFNTLKHLNITDTLVEDITPLSSLIKLEYLSIGGTGVSDIGPLAKLRGLKRLHLNLTPVNDVSVLSKHRSPDVLDIVKTQVHDTSPLNELIEGGLELVWDKQNLATS